MDIIDRRLNPKGKSLGNRQRFINRARRQLRQAVGDRIRARSIADSESGEEVVISSDGIHEPTFSHDPAAGRRDHVLPGNKEFVVGDRIRRPAGGAGRGGSEPGEGPESEDDFVFALTRDEFLDLFFEDLQLPDLVKERVTSEKAMRHERAGFSVTGAPSNLNLVRTMRNSLGRRIALSRPRLGTVEWLEQELTRLEGGDAGPEDEPVDRRIAELEERLVRARHKRANVPFIDPVDVRYNRFEKVPKPIAQAVMFCLMDVSASMTETRKDVAKRFFMMLHLFLTRRYDRIEVVFIRHTDRAAEVDEQTFFYGLATGGTVVSTALDEMVRVVEARYSPADWNIYVSQASDGDNGLGDVGRCTRLLETRILPITQYMAYVEIDDGNRIPAGFQAARASTLWSGYVPLVERHANFAMRKIGHPRDIYPVFRGLFSREGAAA